MRTTWIPAIAAVTLVAAACNRPEEKKPEATAVKTDAKTAEVPGTPPAAITPMPPAVAASAAALLIPDQAALLAHVDLQALGNSPLFAANRSLMDQDPEVKKQMDALAACNMPMSGFRTLDLGVGSDGGDVAAIVVGDGIGVPANLKCMQSKVTGERFEVEEKDGVTRLVFNDGDVVGHLVAPDTLAFVTKKWSSSVMDLVAGKGTPARTGALADVLAQVDQSKHVWFAGTVPPPLAQMAATLPGGVTGMKSVTGSLDLTAGLALVLSFGMEDAAKASTTLAQVQKQFTEVKPMAGLLGVPASAVDKVQFSSRDNAVTLTASLSMDEITTMKTAMDQKRGDAATPPPAGALPSVTDQPGDKPLNGGVNGVQTDLTKSGTQPGSKQAASNPTTPGSTAPTGASPTPTGDGVPASDIGSKQAGGDKAK